MLPHVGPRGFLRLTQLSLGIVVLNIVSGAAVRLSDSGLGCPDWPTCSQHHLTPPLSLHPAIEFSNRMVVVVLCIVVACVVITAAGRRPWRRDLVLLSVSLIGGIVAEAVLGAVVVYTKLNPYAVMTHFMVGIGLLTIAFVLVLRAGRAPGRGRTTVAPGERRIARMLVALLLVAIAAGTATTGAGPHAGGKGATRLPVPLADMARLHSSVVLVLGAATLLLLYRLERTRVAPATVQRGRILVAAMVGQGVVGYTQYFTHLPVVLVGMHVFGATVVWMAMLWFFDGLSHHRADTVAVAAPGAEGASPSCGGPAVSGAPVSGVPGDRPFEQPAPVGTGG